MDKCALRKLKSGGNKRNAGRGLAVSICIFVILLFGALAAETGYNITLDLPQTDVHNVTLSLTVPQGLIYDGILNIEGADTSLSEIVSGDNDGSGEVYVYYNFGTVDNDEDLDIKMTLGLMVANILSNQNGVFLQDIRAILRYEYSNLTDSYSYNESGDINILEPDLDLTKGGITTKIKVNRIVSYTITVEPSEQSSSDAFSVDVIDSIPYGLIYQGDASDSGVYDEVTSKLSWHLSEIKSSKSLTYTAKIVDTTAEGLINTVDLTWASTPVPNSETRNGSDGASGLNDYYRNVTNRLFKLNLSISKEGSPDPVISGGTLNYIIHAKNWGEGGAASWARVSEIYDENITFISSDPLPEDETNSSWYYDPFNVGDKYINILVKVNKSLPNETLIENKVTLTSEEEVMWEDTITTMVICPNISIVKNAFNSTDDTLIGPDDSVQMGDKFYYRIDLENIDQINATNVTVTDILDNNITNNITSIFPEPDPSSSGNTLFWNASILGTERFNTSESVSINISVDLTDNTLSGVDELNNTYKFDTNEIDGEYKYLHTNVSHTVFISKVAEKDKYSPGDLVNYTITYGNSYIDNENDFQNVTIYDILPDPNLLPGVEYVEAIPTPTYRRDNILIWKFGVLPANTTRMIKLTVRIKERPEVYYEGNRSVSGDGYVFARKWFTTHHEPYNLINYVNITAYFFDDDRPPEKADSSAIITVEDPGTEIKTVEHGSGSFETDELIKYNDLITDYYYPNWTQVTNASILANVTNGSITTDGTILVNASNTTYELTPLVRVSRNKTIEMSRDMLAIYHPTTLNLYRNRSVNYTSRWSTEVSAKNRATGASLHESYRYATLIDRDSHYKLDENGSLMEVDVTFEGVGHFGVLKRDPDSPEPQNAPEFQSFEDYRGSFSIEQSAREKTSERSVSGEGFVSSDKRIGESQRTYEYGTGLYETDEMVSASENAIYKDIKVAHQPTSFKLMDSNGTWSNSSIKWEEATRSKTEGISYIGEEIHSADYIYADIQARGLNELHTEANFSGTARYRAFLKDEDEEHEVDELYSGKFTVAKKILFTGVPRYDHPHISVSKTAFLDPNTTLVKYLINITNDGNKPLAPVYVRDTFPAGTAFVNSSMRPSKLTSTYANWTLTSLSIGREFSIELYLDVTESPSNLINIVEAGGAYNDQWISARDFSAVEVSWLTCCPTDISAKKTASIDPSAPDIANYRLSVNNTANYTMVAHITDNLPAGMTFLDSSLSPSSYGVDYIKWALTDISPGEVRYIDYRTQASGSGTYRNSAYIDAWSLDGPGSASAVATASITIGIPGEEAPPVSISDWELPNWDFNHTEDLAEMSCEEICTVWE